jgi:hypothetical protein
LVIYILNRYAERADVILLFFDPDKPGTTGETLSILTNALNGLDHKLHIILNKADQFKKIHDFARAYGSLCWNLSKVIHRKDLPRIYTMCLPSTETKAINTSISHVEDAPSFSQGLADLEATRKEVVREVMNAPKRRLDNEISRLADAAALLHLHASVMSDVLDSRTNDLMKSRAIVASVGVLSVVASGSSLVACFASDFASSTLGFAVSLPGSAATAITLFSVLFTGGVVWMSSEHNKRRATQLVEEDLLGGRSFNKIYAKRIVERDETLLSNWSRVREHIKSDTSGMSDAELLSLLLSSRGMKGRSDLRAIERLIEEDIPALRRRAAPEFNK